MQRKILVTLATVALLVSLSSIWMRLRTVTPKIDRTPIIGAAAGIGETLAKETIEVVHDQGRIVLVTDHDHAASGTPRDYRWEKFREELKKHSSVTIAATEIVEFDPNEPMVSGCPSAAFKEILNRHASVSAIVFFIDLPEWIRVADGLPKDLTAKIIAVDNMGVSPKSRYDGYFAGGILSALIVRRSSELASPAEPKTPREWFDKFYQVYTAQNYESLPE